MKYIQWMNDNWDNIKDINILNITLPGTHDSGSYSCNPTLGMAPFAPKITKNKLISTCFGGTIRRWADSQGIDLYQQLSCGARYLDLRVCVSVNDHQIRTEHSMYGTTFDDLFNQINCFLMTYRKEFVILHLRHFQYYKMYDMPDKYHEEFIGKIKQVFGDIIIKEKDFQLPLEELLKNKKRVFVFYGDAIWAEKYDFLINPLYIWNPWMKSDNVPELLNKLVNTIHKRKKKERQHKFCFCLQSCLTPDTQIIEKGILNKFKTCFHPTVPTTLKDIAIEVNNKLLELYNSRDNLNIVSVDWLILFPNLVKLLIDKNLIFEVYTDEDLKWDKNNLNE